MQTDLQRLSEYHQRGSAVAFRDLVQSHSTMVQATARRITRDDAMAQDITQETFVKLARQSRAITESVAAWLHRVASRLACNAIRDDSTRRRHEQSAALSTPPMDEGSEAPWSEVEPELDAIIDELPEELRAPLVMHFLEGRSQRDIARELKTSQSTVNRAVDTGLAELRKRLRGRGVLCGAGLGALLLAQSAAAAAAPVSASLFASLTKIGMSGIGGSLVPAAAAGLGVALLAKIAAGVLVTAGAATLVVTTSGPSIAPVAPVKPSMAVPAPISPSAPTLPKALPVMPVHELVHSFRQPLPRPSGAMVRVDDWIWGTTNSGGEYGSGTLFKVRPDGSDWQEVLAFKGTGSAPLGHYPNGLIRAKDGALWGTTSYGGAGNEGTLFRFDPATNELTTMIEFGTVEDSRPGIAVAEAPDGAIWGTTERTVFRFDPTTAKVRTIARFTGKDGTFPGMHAMGGVVLDANGHLWGTTRYGGHSNCGTVFSIDLATRKVSTVAHFTGTAGALPGNSSLVPMTPDGRGWVWGTTELGGPDDNGVVFKVNTTTKQCVMVAPFTTRGEHRTGTNPMAALAVDEDGHLWGGTRYALGLGKGSGNLFKVNRDTGLIRTQFFFTGKRGAYPGGPLRGPMLADGKGGFFGVCNFGGLADFGTIFRVHATTGAFTLLKDLSEFAKDDHGADPRGRLTSSSDGWLWGVAENGGASHCGSVFKFDPITDALVTVIEFTGNVGACKGTTPRAGLISDGRGFMWGTTTGGGSNERGTIFKINERTGAFTTVHEFGLPGRQMGPAGAGPETELVADGRGFFWGTTKYSVYKVSVQSGEVRVIRGFTGDRGRFPGSEPETLALDEHGYMWGAALGEPRKLSAGTIFKINTVNDEFTLVESLADARRGSSALTHRIGDMYSDGRGAMWMAGPYARGVNEATRTLVKFDASTGQAVSWHRFGSRITTPVMDDRGLLWGISSGGGPNNAGSVYCFDPASGQFTTAMEFTGAGAQARTGEQPERTRFFRHSDGNLYAGTRFGGPGNGGTVFRLRFGPTPMTQEATQLANGSAELHGTLRPNGLDSEAVFEWGTDAALAQATIASAGIVKAADTAQSVSVRLNGLTNGTTYYFRVRGKNDNNRIPQRGAILSFTMTEALLANTSATDQATSLALDSALATSAASRGHALQVVRIPGAGAGFVRGALSGAKYQVGKRYSLSAVADNDYIFSHWSGAGISGAQAESRQLSFVFSDALAAAPMITATFVKNPFRNEVTSHFDGLVLAAEGIEPAVSNTGAATFALTSTGNFTGELRYDQRRIALAGSFDTGGLARFGVQRDPSLILPATADGHALLIALQLDLSAGEAQRIHGSISVIEKDASTLRSIIEAERATSLANEGRYQLTISHADGKVPATMLLSPNGSAALVAKLPDGTGLLSGTKLSQAGRAAFFAQLYAKEVGSLGGYIVMSDLREQPFWWSQPPPGPGWQDVSVELVPSGAEAVKTK